MIVFECKMCGECCYGQGGIYLTDGEAERIALFLGTDRAAFIEQRCEQKNGRTYIRTGKDGFCIFYDTEKSCRIHPVKPERCALWPFFPANVADRESWELAKGACPGINPDCTFEEFVRASRKPADKMKESE
jgi:hypothetical protein